MKYSESNLTDEELRNKSMIKGNTSSPCFICKEDTEYIEFCSEQHICSQECNMNLIEMYIDSIKKMQDMEHIEL